jgi:non-ribosomal peptide synthetase component E (peptide arylation enzyme)
VPQVLAVEQRPGRASGIARVEGQTAASTIMALGAGSTLPGVLDASNRGNDLGLIVAGGGPKLTHAQLVEQIEVVGAQLRSFGVKPGQLVTLVFPNTIEVSSGWHEFVCRVLC